MIQSFADVAIANLWTERDSKAARRVLRDIWPTMHRKLTMIDAAPPDDCRARLQVVRRMHLQANFDLKAAWFAGAR